MYRVPFFYNSLLSSPLFYALIVLDLVLKGVALYKSARKGQTIWFVALLLVNSMGILPIIYLLINKDVQFVPAKPAAKGTTKRAKRK